MFLTIILWVIEFPNLPFPVKIGTYYLYNVQSAARVMVVVISLGGGRGGQVFRSRRGGVGTRSVHWVSTSYLEIVE